MSGGLPDPERLDQRQLIGVTCALCGRYLGIRARELGTVRHARYGYTYRLWGCLPECAGAGAGAAAGAGLGVPGSLPTPVPARHHAPRPAGPSSGGFFG
ncbi:hypothetical protein [Streptomyces specialis]|uniref:hypothetical protein n=1 Tax=Streptomyces specialis TaxID=498367 RepID=UPI00073F94C2|nr:hypothetical protein [Streptomyces specialis]